MPAKRTEKRARAQKKKGNSASNQAIAIGLSRARKAGVKVKGGKKATASMTPTTHAHKKTSAKRSAASTRALKREPKRAASHAALSRHAKKAALTAKRRS